MYDNSGIPSKILTLDAVAPLNAGWNKVKDSRWGANWSISTHLPWFPLGRSSPYHLSQACDDVFHSSTNYMHNFYSSDTSPPQIPLPPPSRNRIWNRGHVSAPSTCSIIGVLTISVYSFSAIPPPNDIYEGDSEPGLNKYQDASNLPNPLSSSPPPPPPPHPGTHPEF